MLGMIAGGTRSDVIEMEGCPRSLMLTVALKESFPTEFTTCLKKVIDRRVASLGICVCGFSKIAVLLKLFQYIQEHYHEDADSYSNETSALEQLRTVWLNY